jgi:DNA repair protein RecN (Recombination protein N)
MIHSLCQKHRVKSVEELIAVSEKLASQLATITHSDENIENQKALIASLQTKARKQALAIHKQREEAAAKASKRIEEMLCTLGIGEAQLRIDVVACDELFATGCDRIRFMFTANARMEMQPIEKVASGGELSRVMLSLKALLAEHKKLPTIIFDEIDTGVSGRIADAMGDIIRSLSANMQVVAITHLPQVASKGDAHFVVYKEDSRTNITLLTENQRVEEIAKMLSGSVVTDAALEQARLLLKK